MDMNNHALSTQQDRLAEGKLRLKGGEYIDLDGVELNAANDGSMLEIIWAEPLESQDRLSAGLVKGRGRNGATSYYEIPRRVTRYSGCISPIFPVIHSIDSSRRRS